MKVVTLLGSPRANGNTATLAKAFNEAAQEQGADVKTYLLNKLNFKGCQACEACKTKSDKCVLADDLTEVLDAVAETDILVLASPVYFADTTAQLKGFVDRCYSYMAPFETMPEISRLVPGKIMVFLTTQNAPDELFSEVAEKYSSIFKHLGFLESRLVRGCDLMAADDLKTKNRQDLIELAKQTAQEVVAPNS